MTQTLRQPKAYAVRVERNVLVPLADGVEVAADVYLPDAPGTFPALVSYYPYHKDDLIGGLFEHARREFTARGYASVLADFRGTGGSAGVCTDTFDAVNEGKDGAAVVEWAAAQDWCDGAVGVWGMSYGGLMSLAIAAQRPPHLKAIAPLYGTADIWRDFVAPGGCANCLGNYARESFMLAMDLSPPMLQDREGRWLRVWKQQLDRLARGELHSLHWQARPDYDEHWRFRRIPVEQIEVPAFVIGGWRDIFPEAMPDVYARLPAPKRLLMGPWVHTPPDWSPYEPYDWIGEVSRWWDRWLKGEENGVDEEPPVTLFVQGTERWKHEREWPIARTEVRTLYAAPGGALAAAPPASDGGDVYESDPTVGTAAGLWDPLGTGIGYPLEQSEDNLRSLTYTSEPLPEDTEVTGSPTATLHVALEQGTELQLVAKLCAIAPDGRSTLLSTGWLNAAHREGPERSVSVPQGETLAYQISMWATSYVVPRGHRLRLSIACADFPRIWPTRTSPTIRLAVGGDAATSITVPVVPAAARVEGPPVPRPEPGVNRAPWFVAAKPRWEIERNLVDGTVSASLGSSLSLQLPTGGTLSFAHGGVATVARDRPDAAAVEAEAAMDIRMPAGEHVAVDTRSRFTRETMLFEGRVTIDGRVFFEGRWSN